MYAKRNSPAALISCAVSLLCEDARLDISMWTKGLLTKQGIEAAKAWRLLLACYTLFFRQRVCGPSNQNWCSHTDRASLVFLIVSSLKTRIEYAHLEAEHAIDFG